MGSVVNGAGSETQHQVDVRRRQRMKKKQGRKKARSPRRLTLQQSSIIRRKHALSASRPGVGLRTRGLLGGHPPFLRRAPPPNLQGVH